MRNKIHRKLAVLIIGMLLPIELLACRFTPDVELVGVYDKQHMVEDTGPGDEYLIKCDSVVKATGFVNKSHELVMSNGARFSVIDMDRRQVLNKIKKVYIMLNTPNGIRISPPKIESHNKAN